MNTPTLYIPPNAALPDNDQYQYRFTISGSSGNQYIVSQRKKGKYWCCNCAGWKRHKVCKHLEAMGLPCKQQPYEPKITGGR